MIGLILAVLLVLILIGGVGGPYLGAPWPHGYGYGWGGNGLVVIILIICLIWIVMGRM
jgi:hypothetical protein